jgi:LPXTG-motif cell wall-anchored protein
MERSKKFLILVSITALVLLTLLGSIVSASAGSGDTEPIAGQNLPVMDQGGQVPETPTVAPDPQAAPAPGGTGSSTGSGTTVSPPAETTNGDSTTVSTVSSSNQTLPDDASVDCWTPPKGQICGTKYVVDATGHKTPKGGVTINLTGKANKSTVTQSNGTYCFSNLEMGTYYVSEVVPAGYVKVIPEGDKYTVTLNVCAPNASCKDFVNKLIETPKGKISGTKYVKDEKGHLTPMGGVTIVLSKVGFAPWTQETKSDGTYCFSNLDMGNYTVTEEVPAGYKLVSPESGSYKIELTECAREAKDKDFVNELIPPPPPPKGKVSGTKFVKDGCDLTPMGGVTIVLSGDKDATTVTAADGTYSFNDLDLGDYEVGEQVPAGYKQIEPEDGTYEFELSVEEPEVAELDFINELVTGSISGHKWQDNNWNKIHDSGEPGMSGITIELWQNGAMITSTVTGADGSYSFDNLTPGNYTVKEVLETGMVPGMPTSVDVTVTGNQEVPGIDFLNYRAYGMVTLEVFVDSNCNGVWDCTDELVTIPVTVELYQVINGQEVPANGYDGSFQKQTGTAFWPTWPPYLTGCAGWQNLPVDDGSGAAWYVLKMKVPDGYYALDSTVRGPYALKVGLWPGSCSWWNERFLLSHEFSITGHKWLDVDGDGNADPKTPVGGVTIELWQNGSKIDSTVTAADGSYSFTGLHEGIYTVKEIVQDGWSAEIPVDGIYKDVHVGCGDVKDLDFLNVMKKGSIHGVKYLDANADGIYEPGSPGFEGVTIQLKQGDTVIKTATTDEDGKYSFTDVPAGTYDVVEVLTGDQATKASTIISGVVVAAGADVSLEEEPFLNYRKGSISGHKWLDTNADSIKDTSENGLAGITINLYKAGSDTVFLSTVTAADGSFSFTGLDPGTYKVAEVQQAKYFATTAESDVIKLEEAGSKEVNFGNAEYGRIDGLKFEDKNGDGIHDSGENGLEGVEVTLTGQGITKTTKSGEDGNFFFDQLLPGEYTVSETVTPGFYASTPIKIEVVVTTGATIPITFSNCEYGKIIGMKFLDDGDNKLSAEKDTPKAGVTIKLTGTTKLGELVSMSTATAADGSFSFLNVEAGTYKVTEEYDTSKYTAVLPSSSDIIILPGDSKEVDFLNSETTVLPQPPITPEVSSETTLPQTGMNQLPLLIGAAVMVLFGLLLLFAGRKRRMSE